MAAQIATWLGADEWDRLPLDILACFVRGYAYRADWATANWRLLVRHNSLVDDAEYAALRCPSE